MRFVRTIAFLAVAVLIPLVSSADTTGSVRGFIRCIDCAGLAPIEDATVTVSGVSGIWKGTTDARGFYVIFGITPGQYKISVFDPKYRYITQLLHSVEPLCMHADENDYVDLYLGHELLSPNFRAVRRSWYLMNFRPDYSATADVYNIGDC